MKKIRFKTIRLFEPKMWKVFRVGVKLTEEKLDWDRKELLLLEVLSKRKLQKEFEKVREPMAKSHRNCKEAFLNREPLAQVLDIDGLGLW